MQSSVLIVEAQSVIRNLLHAYLERDGVHLVTAGSGADALQIASSARPDLIVLDLDLPDLPGEQVARALNAVCPVPIVLLTGPAVTDQVRRLRLDAAELQAEYLTKPVSRSEVVHVVNSALRRVTGHRPPPCSFGRGRLVLDEAAQTICVQGNSMLLTPCEWDLMAVFAQCPGRIYTRSHLQQRIRAHDASGCDRRVDTHLRRLRRKLAGDPLQPQLIQTVIGAGYRLAVRRDDPVGAESTLSGILA